MRQLFATCVTNIPVGNDANATHTAETGQSTKQGREACRSDEPIPRHCDKVMAILRRTGTRAAMMLLASVWTAGCAPALVAQGTSGCRSASADQVRTSRRLSYLKDLVSSSNPNHVQSRQALGIPSMAAAKVKLVTRQQDCQAAVTAMNTYREEPGTVRQVWVYALGTAGYAVDDPALDVPSEDRTLDFFGANWSYKLTQSGF